MSDSGLADDLFGGSEGGGSPAPQPPTPEPVASGSRTPEVIPASPSRSATPAKRSPPRDPDEEEDGDLFGDEDEDEKPDRARSSAPTTPASQRSGSPNPLEYEEQDVIETTETWTNLAIPTWPKMHATDGKVWNLKLPAYINIESNPYDAELYREENTDEPIDGVKEPILAKQKMLGVKNTIRWKWVTGPDGEPMRQSNSRIVRWSDGSVSLQVGDEYFDIGTSYGTTLARPQDAEIKAPISKTQPLPQTGATSNTTFLCVVARDERVLVAETAIAGQLTLLPTSMTSKTHMELVKQVGQQHVKHSRMKLLNDTHDPAKLNELLLKAAGKEKVVQKKVRRTGSSTSGGVGGSRGRKARRAFSDSGSEGGLPDVRTGRNDYEADDGFVVADTDDEDEAEETEDEDEMAWGSKKSKKKSSGKKRKGSIDSLDEMEEAERRIEERERAAKRAKRDKGKVRKSRDYVDTDEEDVDDMDAEGEVDGDDQDMDMDMESEED